MVGELELSYEMLVPAGEPDQALVIYTAEEGTPSTALRLLQTLSAESGRAASLHPAT